MSFSWVRQSMAVLLVGVLASVAAAAEVTLVLTDGSEVTGEMIESNDQQVVLMIGQIRTTFARDRIADFKQAPSLQQEYQQRRRKLADDDVNGHFDLAMWLYKRGSTAADRLALDELTKVIELDPEHEMAELALKVIERRLRALEEPEPTDEPTEEPTDDEDPDKPDARKRPKVLTKEQVNLIKIYEIDPDLEPRVRIRSETIDELFVAYRENPVLEEFVERGKRGRAAFDDLEPHQQLRLMFDMRARELYKQVKVLDEPPQMTTFRKRIHRQVVLQRCASCHNKGQAAGLDLVNVRATSEQAAYTNFLILHRTRAGAGKYRMIDRDKPQKSLLLQYGLPRDAAVAPHPEVRGYPRSFYRSVEDPTYGRVVDWIVSLYPGNVRYPIKYTLPGVKPAAKEGEASAEESDPDEPAGGDTDDDSAQNP